MVICKYFLQGTCRFGNNCKFEHQLNTHDHHNYASSPLLQNYTNKPTQTAVTTTNVDTNTLVKSVVNDMTSAEKGGQWLLSSYAPFKEKPAFPGFEDHSMEEIRYLYYESMKNGTIEQFKQTLQMMLQQTVMKIKALQNPSPDVVNLLKTIYNTPASASHSQINFNSNMVFRGSQPQQQSSMFGSIPTNQNIFNQNPQLVQQSQQSIFGGSTGNSGFSGQTNTVFNQHQNQNKSIFNNSQLQQSNNSVFNGGNAVFNTQSVNTNQLQQAPNFAQMSNFNQSSNFNQQNQQTPFTNQQQNIFQQNSNSQLHNSPTNQFTSQQGGVNKTNSFQHTANIFGNLGMSQQNNPIFGASSIQAKPNEEFYSKLEELTDDEINWFQNDDLDVNKIPEKPPTYEMCFKP